MNRIILFAIVVAIVSTFNGCKDRDNPTNGHNTNTMPRWDTLTLCSFVLQHVHLSGSYEVAQDIDQSFTYRIRRSADTLICDTAYMQPLANLPFAGSVTKQHKLRILFDTVSYAVRQFSYLVTSEWHNSGDIYVDTLFLSGGSLTYSAKEPFRYSATGMDQLKLCLENTFYYRHLYRPFRDPTTQTWIYLDYFYSANTVVYNTGCVLTIIL
jgi:hypothetical protein